MRVGDVMSVRAVTVRPDETVQVAIARMMEENIGAVAVCDGPRIVGIFTERDVLRLAAEGAEVGQLRVGDVMTKNVVTAPSDVHILDAAHLMGERRIRHLPVVEGDNLLGMVGIRDVLRSLVERLWREHDTDARETVRELLRRAR